MKKVIDPVTLGVLSRMEARPSKKGSGMVLAITDGELSRDQYVAVNKVLKAMSGKWDRGEKGHMFDYDPTDRLDQVLLNGVVVDEDKALGFFETPEELAERLVNLADIRNSDLVLEPSAGKGRIARAIRKAAPGAMIECVEIDAGRHRELGEQGFKVWHADFLGWEPLQNFDRIVMNPPFGRQADIAHVRRAYGMLWPGGRLVSVMSSGVKFREDRKTVAFRAFLKEAGGEIISLPPDTFKKSGTSVNTVIIVLNRPPLPK